MGTTWGRRYPTGDCAGLCSVALCGALLRRWANGGVAGPAAEAATSKRRLQKRCNRRTAAQALKEEAAQRRQQEGAAMPEADDACAAAVIQPGQLGSGTMGIVDNLQPFAAPGTSGRQPLPYA